MAFAELVPTLFTELVPSAPALPMALRWCRLLNHPACDCLDLALVAQRSAVWITRDQRLLRRVASVLESAGLVRVLES
jgi:hypothetical protein